MLLFCVVLFMLSFRSFSAIATHTSKLVGIITRAVVFVTDRVYKILFIQFGFCLHVCALWNAMNDNKQTNERI